MGDAHPVFQDWKDIQPDLDFLAKNQLKLEAVSAAAK